MEILLYTYVNDRQQIPKIATGWRVTEKIIGKIVELSQNMKIAYLPIIIPFEGRADKKVWDGLVRSNPKEPQMIQNFPEKRFADFFEKLGIQPILLMSIFQQNEDVVLPYIDGHLNLEGHRLVAESIYGVMLEQNLVGEPQKSQ